MEPNSISPISANQNTPDSRWLVDVLVIGGICLCFAVFYAVYQTWGRDAILSLKKEASQSRVVYTTEEKLEEARREIEALSGTPSATSSADFTHPTASYLLRYPPDWSLEVQTDVPPAQKYANVTIKSPDHQTGSEEGILEEGAEFGIFVEETQETDIENAFKNDVLASKIATNKISSQILIVNAIQYDYSYEGVTATITEFIGNGKKFTVKYQYPDPSKKETYMREYRDLLISFRP